MKKFVKVFLGSVEDSHDRRQNARLAPKGGSCRCGLQGRRAGAVPVAEDAEMNRLSAPGDPQTSELTIPERPKGSCDSSRGTLSIWL